MSSSFGPSKFGGGMKSVDRPSRGVGKATTADLSKSRPKPKLKKVMPEVWKLIKPRRWLLFGSFFLIILNRVCSFALPVSSKFLINNVMLKHQMNLLPWIIGTVAAATFIQGLTSYTLTQLLSTAGQRLISELRTQVQEHIGRLPVAFYDENRTGTLVARIMTDVEGVRNLVGTGLLEFVGGILTAIIAFCILIRISGRMTLLTFCILLVFGVILQKAFKTIRPIFRERSKINAEVTGRLTESLGGVRVVKGYHAEASEARVFAAGVKRLLDNVISSITAQSLMTLSSTMVLGVVGGLIMYLGAREISAHRLDVGGYVEYTMLLAFMVAPVVQLVSIGTQLTEALAGLDRTSEILSEREEDSEPARTVTMPAIHGDVAFNNVTFAYEADKPVLHGISFESKPGTVTRPRWLVRIRQVHHHLAHLRLPHRQRRPGADRWHRPCHDPALKLSAATWRGSAGDLPLRWKHSRKYPVLASERHRGAVDGGLPHRPRR